MTKVAVQREAGPSRSIRHFSGPAETKTSVSNATALKKSLSLLTCSSLFFAMRITAQEFRATISGTVADPSGAMVPGANVTVLETQTGAINRTVSDHAGQYVVPFLLPGNYSITAERPGFQSLTRNGITLLSQGHLIINLVLKVGSASQTVMVNGQTSLLDLANASVGDLIETKSAADLPLNGRTPASLAELSVGYNRLLAPGKIRPFDTGSINKFSIAGTPEFTSELLMDGVPDQSLYGQWRSAQHRIQCKRSRFDPSTPMRPSATRSAVSSTRSPKAAPTTFMGRLMNSGKYRISMQICTSTGARSR
jgi:Carboxypeptidase regulatory-like domain